jgi:AcrR family transcriptional regulator
MSAKRMVVSMQVLREAVERQVEATSLRHVAADIGIGPTTLYNFIRSEIKTPYSINHRKLLTWYVQSRHEVSEIDAHAAAASLELLTLHFPVRQRRNAQRQILGFLEQLRGEGVPSPQWISDIKRR